MKVNGVLPAAGFSSRMGDFKPLMPLAGKTVIENSIDVLLDAGAECVVAVLGCRGSEVAAILKKRYPENRVKTVYNEQYAVTDMLASVQIGIRALPACDAFFILPADAPAADPATCRAVILRMAETGAPIACPTVGGRLSHPPLLSSALIEPLLRFREDGGIRAFLDRNKDRIAWAAVDDAGSEIDIDTMEDYKRLQQYMERRRV